MHTYNICMYGRVMTHINICMYGRVMTKVMTKNVITLPCIHIIMYAW